MEISTLVSVLDQPHLAAAHLYDWGLADVRRGQHILLELAETPDPDAALAAFHRFMFAVRSPLSLAALFERDETALPMLLGALSLGPQWADLLAEDPEAFDLLRQTAGSVVDGSELLSDLIA